MQAQVLIVLLLLVILMINTGNLWYAARFHNYLPGLTGFSRGMTLLLGPLFYGYTLAITRPSFRLHPKQLLHFIPYAIAVSGLLLENAQLSPEAREQGVQAFISGDYQVNYGSIVLFGLYVAHLLIYTFLAQRHINTTLQNDALAYRIPTRERAQLLRQINVALVILSLELCGWIIYMLATGTYTYVGNAISTLVLSVLAYVIAYKAILHREVLLPDFQARYANVSMTMKEKVAIVQRMEELFDAQHLYTQPDLTLSALAKQLDCSPHALSMALNSHLSMSFSEVMHHYRIDAFKQRALDPAYSQFTLIAIAEEVGYTSKATFNKAFKHATGMTPSEFVRSERA